MEAPPRQQSLPLDLQIEIAARSDDGATVVRCAATSKPLRRAILEPAFRRRLADIAAAKGCRVVPALVMAASYRVHRPNPIAPFTVRTSRPGLRFDTSILESFQPACSSDGLLLLRRDYTFGAANFHVCDTLTGVVTSVPNIDRWVPWGSRSSSHYCPALITLDDAGRSFELIVLHRSWQIQTYSSSPLGTSGWSAARCIKSPLGRRRTPPMATEESLTAPIVIGRTVHWLCNGGDRLGPGENIIIIALHADTAQATAIRLPTVVRAIASGTKNPFRNLLLAATTDGKLSVVAVEALAMSMWTLSPEDDTWGRHLVIDRQLTAGLVPYTAVQFQWFGKMTGTLLLVMDHVGLVQIDMGTKKATVLHGIGTRGSVSAACLHEIDVVSLLQRMKPF